MAEPATLESPSTQTSEENSSRVRWLRLLRSALWCGGYIAIVSLAADIYSYVQGDTLDVGGSTRDLVLEWLIEALVTGLFFGLIMAFPPWLAREEFPPPKHKQRKNPS
ncbi:MAG TPA: hypothetical protein VJM12_20935 [Pyrinomonadaceae bacterium]|nr:hypothetical protein [Pyrinomonadaceae bacterium]